MGTATYAYDASGNRTSKSDPSTGSGQAANYAWSSGNELTGVTHTPSGDGVTYRYDALGRRLQRVHTVAGSGTTDPSAGSGQADEFVYDGLDLLVMNRGGAVYQQYVHGPGSDQPLALLDYSTGSLAVYYYHADRLGSVRALTDAAQAVVQSYTYSAFGVTTVGAPGGLDQPFRYTGREWDTAAGLYYYRARWYDAEAGRFVSPDPIGLLGGGTNLYRYVSNNPVVGIDPLGLFSPTMSGSLVETLLTAAIVSMLAVLLLEPVRRITSTLLDASTVYSKGKKKRSNDANDWTIKDLIEQLGGDPTSKALWKKIHELLQGIKEGGANVTGEELRDIVSEAIALVGAGGLTQNEYRKRARGESFFPIPDIRHDDDYWIGQGHLSFGACTPDLGRTP